MLTRLLCVLLVLHICAVQCQSGEKDANLLYGEASASDKPTIYYMKAVANITNRYVTTVVTCRIRNPSVVSQEAAFSVILPEKAFITDFVMEIHNRSYKSYVKEKEEAQRIYDTAVNAGQAAAQVKVSVRDSKRFSVNINLEPEDRAVFYLTYEELLVKKLGKYEAVLNVYPGQIVNSLRMEVLINEGQPIEIIKKPTLRLANQIGSEGIESGARVTKSGHSARIRFNPDISEQRRLARSLGTSQRHGISAQFVVQYDVKQEAPGGHIVQSRSHFAHYFTPKSLPTLPKYIIFILDTSGSMYGEKLDQLKSALNDILSRLTEKDYFNIVEFSSRAKAWDVVLGDISYTEGTPDANSYDYADFETGPNVIPSAHPASKTNIQKAKSIVSLLEPYGGTDINSALKVGFKILDKNRMEKQQPIVIFLTDGEANIGLTDTNQIVQDITQLNNGRAPIYTLSLGYETQRDFLDRLSIKNNGSTKLIYPEQEIALQLDKFFQEVEAPLLKDIKFVYGGNVSELTETQFLTLFKGSELVVVGKKKRDTDIGVDGKPQVTGVSVNGNVKLVPSTEKATSSMKRLWAYLKVQQLLKQRKIVEDNARITKKALDLALKYSFVTELTSLVVVKPEKTNIVDTEDDTTKAPPTIAHSPPADPAFGHGFVNSGGNKDSGSFIPMQLPATSRPLPTSTRRSTTTDGGLESESVTPSSEDLLKRIETLKKAMPWLNNSISNNGTVSKNGITLKFDIIFKTIAPLDCSNPENVNGKCLRIFECTKLHRVFKNITILDSYACPLFFDGNFGVCCV